MTGDDPRSTYRFCLTVDGEHQFWFQDANGLNIAPEDAPAARPRKLPGLLKVGLITFRKGVAGSGQALDWANSTPRGARKSVRVAILDEDGSEACAWQARSAWPAKFSGDESGVEVLELAYEEMARER